MRKLLLLLGVLALCFTGCGLRTVEELYCLPKRSESYIGLHAAIEEHMNGLEYSAPLSGDNQQIVQMADLDGDGHAEFLLFAKGASERPLQILIFSENGEECTLLDTIECSGSAFEQVEYVQMDDRRGVEIVVSQRVSGQSVRSVNVYTLRDGQMEQLMTTQCAKFVCCDLDGDFLSELLILRPGEAETDPGTGELYDMRGGVLERSTQAVLSEPASKIHRILAGRLENGVPAVYVASEVDGSAIVTDVFALVDGAFTNVTISNSTQNRVETLRNHYLYAEDIDGDGTVELPSLSTMVPAVNSADPQYLVRWYSMASTGETRDKVYTYHNFVGGWYCMIEPDVATTLSVNQQGNSYEFVLWDKESQTSKRLFTIYVLTGQKREEQATANNQFVLYRTESTVYAANLEVASASFGISRESLIGSFHLIQPKWDTGEII